jgi:hypothetical protein
MDSAGNLYGTTIENGAFGLGMAFELAKSSSGYTFTDLHDFTGGLMVASFGRDWCEIRAEIFMARASVGGANGDGVVYEITP